MGFGEDIARRGMHKTFYPADKKSWISPKGRRDSQKKTRGENYDKTNRI